MIEQKYILSKWNASDTWQAQVREVEGSTTASIPAGIWFIENDMINYYSSEKPSKFWPRMVLGSVHDIYQ